MREGNGVGAGFGVELGIVRRRGRIRGIGGDRIYVGADMDCARYGSFERRAATEERVWSGQHRTVPTETQQLFHAERTQRAASSSSL